MKAYFMKDIWIWDDGQWLMKDLLFTENKFYPVWFKSQLHPREIKTDYFVATPGKVYVDLEFSLLNQERRMMHARRYLFRGASLVIVVYDLPVESLEWRSAFQCCIQELSQLPVDYMVVPKLNVKHLKPEIIRYFSLQKSPFILVYIDSPDELKMKWEWIYQEQKLFRIPLAVMKSEQQKMLKQFLADHDFLMLPDELSHLPLSKQSLRLAGIGPRKGEIYHNGATDFNLYNMEYRQSSDKEEMEFFHDMLPFITFIRGNMIKLNQTVNDQKGFGQHMQITIPQHFQL